jgi:hypothetical protein
LKKGFDYFELRVNPANQVSWDEPTFSNPDAVLNLIAKMQGQEANFEKAEKDVRPSDIYINGKFFVDIIREIEEPVFVRENLQRDAESQLIAGDYLSLPASLTYLPCRNLLDEPDEFAFVTEPDDIHFGKSTLLGCTCGILECWFLVAKISLTETTVTWSNFGQFHLDYEYEIEPFVFDRKQYENELVGKGE